MTIHVSDLITNQVDVFLNEIGKGILFRIHAHLNTEEENVWLPGLLIRNSQNNMQNSSNSPEGYATEEKNH